MSSYNQETESRGRLITTILGIAAALIISLLVFIHCTQPVIKKSVNPSPTSISKKIETPTNYTIIPTKYPIVSPNVEISMRGNNQSGKGR